MPQALRMQADAEETEEKRMQPIVNEMAFPQTTVVFPAAASGTRLVSLLGVRMDRPGRVHIARSSGRGVLEEVQVGDKAVAVGEGKIRA